MFANSLDGLTVEELKNLELIIEGNKPVEVRTGSKVVFTIPSEGNTEVLSGFTINNLLGAVKSLQNAANNI